MITDKFTAQSGKSLIEMLIVLAVMAILVTFAIARLGRAPDNFRRQNITREFKVDLERARFDSVKRRPESYANMAKVIVNGATSFSVALDLNQNGTIETTEIRVINFSRLGDVRIVGNNLVFPITISFNRLGHSTAVDGNGAYFTPVFIVCSENCTPQTATAANSSIISVSPTGTVAMLNGGETMPTFGNPAVTNVDPGSDVNAWVAVAVSSPTPTPTGSPTGSPTATPTASPTASPSVSPSVSPSTSPSATPTPRACVKNEKPAQTGCQCQLPMTVKPSGKCM